MCNHKFKPLAVGIHSHLEFSLDGGSTADSKLRYAASIGRVADTLTDHGILSGLASHWMSANNLKKKKVLPKDFTIIQGVEAYIIDPHRPWEPMRKGSKILEPLYYHLTIHFKTTDAYFHFCKLSKKGEDNAVVKFGERKPLIEFKDLEAISDQITLGSGCISGPIQKNVMVGRYGLAEEMYQYLRNMVGPENFYVEVFPHVVDHNWVRAEINKVTKDIVKPGFFDPIKEVRDWEGDKEGISPLEVDECSQALDIQKKPNQFIIELAEKYGDKVVISLDDHFGHPDDRIVQELRLGRGQERWKFYSSYHALTSEEAAVRLKNQLGVSNKQLDEWIDNGYEFVEKFDKYKFPTQADQTLLPTVEMVYDVKFKGKTNKEIFWELVEKHGKMPSEDSPDYKKYKERVDYELSVVADNGSVDFLTYFFLLEDVCNWARANDILFTSRGSAGGCMCLYLIGVVITDPFLYGLSFERFLNPGRIAGGSWPDVDLDWEDRQLIINYLKERYGDGCALIANDSKMRLKSSILDASRFVYGHVPDEIAALTKNIKIPLGTADDRKWLSGEEKNGTFVPGFWDSDDPIALQLKAFAKNNEEIWGIVKQCMGITRQRGVHAGGVVITPGPVSNYIPVIKTSKGEDYATAYNMGGAEYTGGVKYDMLGVKILASLGVAVRSIKKDEGIDLGWGEYPDDEDVVESIIKGMNLEGIFQINTNVAKPFVKRIKPKNIHEISNLIALGRPGTLDADAPNPDFKGSAAEYYVAVSQGKEKPYFIHEDLREILEDTNGVLLMQEQAIYAGVKLCGYTEGEADLLIRKGIGKKIQAKIEQFSNDLRTNLPQRGWSEEQIDAFISMIMASSNYSFNRAHSASYAIVAWNCCWVKHHYPMHFWKGLLTVFSDKEDKLVSMMTECKNMILPVSVIKSHPTDWLIEGDKLRTPLNIIKGCGDKGVEKLNTFVYSDFDTLRRIKEEENRVKEERKAKKDGMG